MILAIDQATTSGYAVVREDGSVVESGVWHLADRKRTGESRGMRYVRFRHEIEQTLQRHPEIGLIVHEQTLMRGGAPTEIANGFKALILEAAASRGLNVSCVHTSELKKFATGSGRAEKQDMVLACQTLGGVVPIDDNEADAVLIGLWAAAAVGSYQAPVWPRAGRRKKQRPARDWIDDIG